ncbi:MAG: CoA-transferase, partial [Acidimicrobiales bacterium]|nr:CoA-transferase [Acidimicrobiales bacterium]
RMRTLGAPANRFHDVYRIVSNLGVFDFETPDQRMRLRSIHPGVEIDTLLESTDFDLVVPTGVEVTRTPTDEEIEIMNMLDPKGLRHLEVPE